MTFVGKEDEMEDLNHINRHQHRMMINNRQNGSFTGITNVIAFDEGEVILETEMGTLSIKGEGLQIKRLDLDKKEADIEGRMDSFGYSEKKGFGAKGESFWSRLFR